MDVVLHIGLPKTGTTALQRLVFPELRDLSFLTHGGRLGGHQMFRGLAGNLIGSDERDFLPQTLASFVANAGRATGRVLVSHESLSGSIFNGCRDRERTAERLHRVFPDAQVVFSVRDQRSFLASWYDQIVRRGAYASLDDFLSDRIPGAVTDLAVLEYDRIFELYNGLFDGRVVVLAHEQLRADPVAYLRTLFDTIGTGAAPEPLAARLQSTNQSLSPVGRQVMRLNNRWLRQTPHSPGAPVDLRRAHNMRYFVSRVDERFLPNARRPLRIAEQAMVDHVAKRYGPSNRRLASLTGLDVVGYGYPSADTCATEESAA